MRCLICGSQNIETKDTVVSDFVMARICSDFSSKGISNYKTNLCFCKDCTFAFYDYRFNDDESARLYADYRCTEYQKVREKYECWYTSKVNDALNGDSIALCSQKQVIEQIIKKNVKHELISALDYGGNEGRTFTDLIGTQEKYVFDISGVPTIKGVIGISDFEELKGHSFDFIMCNHLFEHLADPIDVLLKIKEIGKEDTIYYIEVPSENPFIKGDKFSIKNNISIAFNPNFNIFKLAKYFFKLRRQPFMPMKEHINFFTTKSIRLLAENNGFEVIDISENTENAALGKITVLSMLFKKRK